MFPLFPPSALLLRHAYGFMALATSLPSAFLPPFATHQSPRGNYRPGSCSTSGSSWMVLRWRGVETERAKVSPIASWKPAINASHTNHFLLPSASVLVMFGHHLHPDDVDISLPKWFCQSLPFLPERKFPLSGQTSLSSVLYEGSPCIVYCGWWFLVSYILVSVFQPCTGSQYTKCLNGKWWQPDLMPPRHPACSLIPAYENNKSLYRSST